MDNYIRLIGALGLVLLLIAIFALLLKRFGPHAGLPVQRKGTRRLGVVEVMALDARRRLVLVRRDGVEHLLLLGLGDDRVVETGIIPPPVEPPPSTPPATGFKALLTRQGQARISDSSTDQPA